MLISCYRGEFTKYKFPIGTSQTLVEPDCNLTWPFISRLADRREGQVPSDNGPLRISSSETI